jgi:topoisomerase-4 subunit A
MLVFPVKNLPVLSKGKGNKIINIASARAKSREEYVSLLTIVPAEASITLHAGKRKLTLKANDILHYQGERGRRGNKLPRGLQRVDRVEVETLEPKSENDVSVLTED